MAATPMMRVVVDDGDGDVDVDGDVDGPWLMLHDDDDDDDDHDDDDDDDGISGAMLHVCFERPQRCLICNYLRLNQEFRG